MLPCFSTLIDTVVFLLRTETIDKCPVTYSLDFSGSRQSRGPLVDQSGRMCKMVILFSPTFFPFPEQVSVSREGSKGPWWTENQYTGDTLVKS